MKDKIPIIFFKMPFGKSSGPLNALEVWVDGPKIEPIQSILIDGQGAWPISATNGNIGPANSIW